MYGSKVKVFWNDEIVGFQMVLAKKTVLNQKKSVFEDFTLKCMCSWISVKTTMVGATNFGLVLGLVNAMIFIN